MTLYKGNDNQSTYALIKTGTKLTHKKDELVQNFSVPFYPRGGFFYDYHEDDFSYMGGGSNFEEGIVNNNFATGSGNATYGRLWSLIPLPLNYLNSIKNADSWEIGIKCKYMDGDYLVRQILIADIQDGNYGINNFGLDVRNRHFSLNLSNSGSAVSIGSIVSDEIVSNTIYWIKILFTGTYYEMLISTDGVNYSSCGTLESSEKISQESCEYAFLGSTTPRWRGLIYLRDTYIKVNNEFVWKNVDNNGEYCAMYRCNYPYMWTYTKRFLCFNGSDSTFAIPLPNSDFTEAFTNASTWQMQFKFFFPATALAKIIL